MDTPDCSCSLMHQSGTVALPHISIIHATRAPSSTTYYAGPPRYQRSIQQNSSVNKFDESVDESTWIFPHCQPLYTIMLPRNASHSRKSPKLPHVAHTQRIAFPERAMFGVVATDSKLLRRLVYISSLVDFADSFTKSIIAPNIERHVGNPSCTCF